MHIYQKRLFLLHLFLGMVAVLMICGVVFVYSASSVLAFSLHNSAHYFLKRHIIGLIIGIITAITMQWIPSTIIKKTSPIILLGAIILTAATLLPKWSSLIHGSRRWLSIAGFSFQPSELLKVALPLYIAYFLESMQRKRASLTQYYTILALILGVISTLLLLQPDFGLTMTLLLTTLALLFVARFNITHIAYGISGLAVVGTILIAMRPYRLRRLLTFLNPWNDPHGAGFQIIQSLIAIGSGNWTGIGIAHSRQKFFYLPMQHTDFIFAIIAEEIGFIGCFCLLFVYGTLIYTGLKLATQLPTLFEQLTVFGYTTLLGLQTIINLAVATGIAPTKGMGLPFISYGSTALVCNCIMIGIITRITYESH